MYFSTVDSAEVKKFSDLADSWWDQQGPFKHLHLMNVVRIRYIQDILKNYNIINDYKITGLDVLDVGCGGGILSIPLSRLGAEVTGIDASHENIIAAEMHAHKVGCAVCYKHSTAEELSATGKKFDVVCALEIVEHVADLSLFLDAIAKMVKKNGIFVVSTINKTAKSYLQAIMLAEYVLRMAPAGTHNWTKFVKPSEIVFLMKDKGFALLDLKGMKYRVTDMDWHLNDKVDVNYIMALKKL